MTLAMRNENTTILLKETIPYAKPMKEAGFEPSQSSFFTTYLSSTLIYVDVCFRFRLYEKNIFDNIWLIDRYIALS